MWNANMIIRVSYYDIVITDYGVADGSLLAVLLSLGTLT